jgi:hypothetical protein
LRPKLTLASLKYIILCYTELIFSDDLQKVLTSQRLVFEGAKNFEKWSIHHFWGRALLLALFFAAWKTKRGIVDFELMTLSKKNKAKPEYRGNEEVDVSLILINLRLSYEERIRKHENALRFARELKIAGRQLINAESRQSS